MRKFKKIMTLALSAAVLGGLASCLNNPASESSGISLSAAPEQSLMTTAAPTTEPSETEKESKFGKAVVIYFSYNDNTKSVAQMIADEVGCNAYEIISSKPYTTDDLNYANKKSRSYREQNDNNSRPEIEGSVISLSSYDTVFIGYPIWLSRAPRIIDTFVESQSFEGKTVIPFCTSGSSGSGTGSEELTELAENKGKWLAGTRFGSSVKNADIVQWLTALEGELN